MTINKYLLAIIFLALSFSAENASAKWCDWEVVGKYFSCDAYGIRQSVGRGFPRQIDVLRINPAAIPTLDTPMGLEATISNRSEAGNNDKAQISLLRGLSGFGFGFSTWDISSFAGTSLDEHFYGTTYQSSYDTYKNDSSPVRGMRAGFSTMIPLGALDNSIHFLVGASAGKSQSSNSLSPTYSMIAETRLFIFGYSQLLESVADSLPTLKTGVWTGGLQLAKFYLGVSGFNFRTSVGSIRTTIFNFRYSGETWGVYSALKQYSDQYGKRQVRLLENIEINFGSNIALGYTYGLYQYSHSANIEFYF